MEKILRIAAWVIGVAAFYNAIIAIIQISSGFSFDKFTNFIYSITLGAILLPPITDYINKTKHPKLIKVSIGSLFFLSLIVGAMKPDRYSVLQRLNTNKLANLEKLKLATEQYCHEFKKCPGQPGDLLVENYLKLEDLNLDGHSIHDYGFEGTKSCAINIKLEKFLAKDEYKSVSVNCN